MANYINAFERKILRRIFGPKPEDVTWRSRYNHELYETYKGISMCGFARIQRLRWTSHLVRMEKRSMSRSVLERRVEERRPLGRHRKSWQEEVAERRREIEMDGERKLRGSFLTEAGCSAIRRRRKRRADCGWKRYHRNLKEVYRLVFVMREETRLLRSPVLIS